jgi:hypothetical protein
MIWGRLLSLDLLAELRLTPPVRFPVIVCLLSAPSLGFGAVSLAFDQPSEFSEFFSSSSPSSVAFAPGVGLAGSGGVNLSSLAGVEAQIWTFNHSFSPTLSTWKASIAFNNTSSANTPGDSNIFRFGVTTTAAPGSSFGYASNDGGATYLPFLAMGAGNADGGSIGIGNYSGSGEEDFGNSVTVLSTPFVYGWYSYELTVNYLGSGQYSTQSSISKLNADGTFAGVLASTPTSTFTNQALANSPSAYLFLSVYDGAAMDNFETTAVTIIPEPTSAVLMGLSALFLLRRSRRSLVQQ